MKKIMFLIILEIVFSSCSVVKGLIVIASIQKTNPDLKSVKVKGRSVYFIKMRHLAKPAFYSNVKLMVDSFIGNHYIVYVEGPGIKKNGKPYLDTTILKKYRKLYNDDLTINYAEMNALKNFAKKNGLINQPTHEYFSKDPNFKIVDINYVNLMHRYEDRYGEIILDSCDLNTDLGTLRNPCNTLGKKQTEVFRREIIRKVRNEHLGQTILNSNDKKILVMYGANHYKGLKKALRKLKQ